MWVRSGFPCIGVEPAGEREGPGVTRREPPTPLSPLDIQRRSDATPTGGSNETARSVSPGVGGRGVAPAGRLRGGSSSLAAGVLRIHPCGPLRWSPGQASGQKHAGERDRTSSWSQVTRGPSVSGDRSSSMATVPLRARRYSGGHHRAPAPRRSQARGARSCRDPSRLRPSR
jgi:hypothetical protein